MVDTSSLHSSNNNTDANRGGADQAPKQGMDREQVLGWCGLCFLVGLAFAMPCISSRAVKPLELEALIVQAKDAVAKSSSEALQFKRLSVRVANELTRIGEEIKQALATDKKKEAHAPMAMSDWDVVTVPADACCPYYDLRCPKWPHFAALVDRSDQKFVSKVMQHQKMNSHDKWYGNVYADGSNDGLNQKFLTAVDLHCKAWELDVFGSRV